MAGPRIGRRVDNRELAPRRDRCAFSDNFDDAGLPCTQQPSSKNAEASRVIRGPAVPFLDDDPHFFWRRLD